MVIFKQKTLLSNIYTSFSTVYQSLILPKPMREALSNKYEYFHSTIYTHVFLIITIVFSFPNRLSVERIPSNSQEELYLHLLKVFKLVKQSRTETNIVVTKLLSVSQQRCLQHFCNVIYTTIRIVLLNMLDTLKGIPAEII